VERVSDPILLSRCVAGAGFAGARSIALLGSGAPGKVEPPKAATFPG
jgi:hypothetical protein